MPGRNSEYRLAIRIAGEIDKTFPKSMQHSKAELRAIAREASVASAQMGKNIRSGFRDPLNETKGIFTAIEKAGTKAFKAVAKASLAAGAAVGTFSVKTGMDYEKQMSTVKAIAKASDSDSKKLQEEAKRIGATTASTAKEAGQAMEYEAMAGWKPDQIVEATSAIVDLKQSSDELDLATTSDILTDGITAFKMKAKDAIHMADVLAASSTSANTDVAKMGESFKYAGSIAGAQEYSVEDTALNLGLMANSSVKGSMAGTAMRSWIKRMVKPTKESERAMKDLGLSLKDETGKDKSLLEITEDTRKAFGKLKDKNDRTKYATMLAGTAGSTGLLGIVNTSEKDFKSLKDAIYDCDGAAKDLAKTRLDNLAGDVTLLGSAAQGAGIDIYEEIKEPLRDLVQGATEWVGDFAEGFKTSFPTIVREAKEAGEAIADFAEPVLKVGEWMIDNPDVIAGTIAGIGTAVVAHKVVSGVSALAKGLGVLGPVATTSFLPVIGAGAAIAGVGTAIAVSNKQLKEASLDRHFGDVALSMEEVQQAAKEIVGAKKLEAVGELFDSMDSVKKFEKFMKTAQKEISKTKWRLSVGLKISKSDLSDYEKNVKDYVKNAQELITEKGYEVNVATNVIFGNSKEGQELIKDNNAFFKGLDEKAKGLSSEINKKLKKAMKNGLTLDLEEEVNGLLGQLSDITNVVQDAESEAAWNSLSLKWSGAELDADSFKNVAKEAQDKFDELKNGALTAHEKVESSLNARKKLGDISNKEFEKEKKLNDQNYQATVKESKDRSVKFLYNTMMDSYGEKIAGGNYEEGDRDAIREIISYIEEYGAEGKIRNDLNSIRVALNQNALTGFNSWIGNVTGQSQKDIYAHADRESKEIANAYLAGKNKTGVVADAEKDVEEAQKYFNSNPFDFKALLENPAKEAGKDAASGAVNSITKGIQTDLSKGIDVKSDIRLHGLYSLTPTEQKETSKVPKTTKNKPSLNVVKGIKPTPYASGGIATEPVLYVAEAGTSESIIPLNGSARSIDLWKKTGDILGATGSQQAQRVKTFSELLSELTMLMPKGTVSTAPGGETGTPVNIHFSANITINGDADENVIHRAMDDEYARFKKMMKQWEKNKRRVALKGG